MIESCFCYAEAKRHWFESDAIWQMLNEKASQGNSLHAHCEGLALLLTSQNAPTIFMYYLILTPWSVWVLMSTSQGLRNPNGSFLLHGRYSLGHESNQFSLVAGERATGMPQGPSFSLRKFLWNRQQPARDRKCCSQLKDLMLLSQVWSPLRRLIVDSTHHLMMTILLKRIPLNQHQDRSDPCDCPAHPFPLNSAAWTVLLEQRGWGLILPQIPERMVLDDRESRPSSAVPHQDQEASAGRG